MSTGPRVVGQRLPRLDAPGKVTGTAVYAADFALPGMLHGKVLRSREAHARLLGVDAARARTLPGVRAVITAADVPDVRYGGALKDETVFARDKVRYVGQPVAAVAATTREAAEAALAAIDVAYEPLPAVFDVEAALAPGAPLIHEAWPTYTAIPILHREGNVCNRARIAGRPVKIVTTCEEELTAAYPRQSTRVELKTGVTRDGRITAKAGRIWFDTGAFAGSGPGVASVATLVLAGPYRIPNLLIEGYAVYTNKTNCGSYRAPSGPQANFAVESQMDMIADALGIDPLEFRLRNIVHEGDEGPTGQVLTGVGLEECLRRAAAAIDWSHRKPGPWRGKGLACGWWTTTGGSSGVYVKINPDGTVALNTGAPEIGTAALTGATQVLAELLGVDLADINVVSADTFSTPFDFGAQGSRTAFAVGNACRAAVDDLKRRVFALAAAQLGVEPEACRLADKHVLADGKRISLADLARLSQQTGGGLIAQGTFIAPPTAYDSKRVDGHVYPAFHSPSFHAHAVDLSIDPETGDVTIHKYVVAQDVGFAMNPTYIEGQIEGGVAQGLGQALSEEIVYENGRVLNPNLTDYKMPTTLDMPRVETILVQHPSLVGPYGAKGVGEPPNIEPPAAVANAVASATALRLTSLPITAEHIALALRDAGT